MYYGKLIFFFCFASLCIFCCISFSPIKQLDVSTPVFQEETVDSPPPSDISGGTDGTDGMEVSTEPVTRDHTSQLLTDLHPEGHGTAVFGVKSSFFARHLPRKMTSSGTSREHRHHNGLQSFLKHK